MTVARKRQVDLSITPYYHCMVRCVRRAFLCGEDKFTGKSFEHRRGWIVEQLKYLSSLFAMDICAYAVMENHYHVVLHVDAKRAKSWTIDEVITRWSSIFNGNPLINKYRSGEVLSDIEQVYINTIVEQWRNNLTNISWFMRCMNETIARQANVEDDCRGRFWEGRFKSQALLDVKALISCMAYVDLNPIRAGKSHSLEDSDFTSVQERLFALAKSNLPDINKKETFQPTALAAFSSMESASKLPILPMSLISYLSLVDATGRAIRTDKPGYIPEHIVPILRQLGINPYGFIEVVRNYTSLFKAATGSIIELKKFNQHFGKKWSKGRQGSDLLYTKAA